MSESCENNSSSESLFVPLKGGAKKKDKTTDVLLESMETLKKVIENDPTKDILSLMREDMQQAREQDKLFQQMMLAMLQPSVLISQLNYQSAPQWNNNIPIGGPALTYNQALGPISTKRNFLHAAEFFC